MSLWMYMGKQMAKRFDPLFPEMGGLEHLAEVRLAMAQRLENPGAKVKETFFHPIEVEHIRKVLQLLGDDEEAKATIMCKIAFAQMKDDVAG
jgi:hypothetical protein